MMENLDWDRAHTIEEEDDTPEGVLEENVPREGNKSNNISKGDFNLKDGAKTIQPHQPANEKADSVPSDNILRGYNKNLQLKN